MSTGMSAMRFPSWPFVLFVCTFCLEVRRRVTGYVHTPGNGPPQSNVSLNWLLSVSFSWLLFGPFSASPQFPFGSSSAPSCMASPQFPFGFFCALPDSIPAPSFQLLSSFLQAPLQLLVRFFPGFSSTPLQFLSSNTVANAVTMVTMLLCHCSSLRCRPGNVS